MSYTRRQIDVNGLRIGMYVAQLDRPWLETPFLFQGFYIRSEREIEDICRYCQWVEIDIEESDPSIRQALSAAPKSSTTLQSASAVRRRPPFLSRLLGMFGLGGGYRSAGQRPGEYYHDTRSTADELVVAKSVHSGALDSLVNILADIRKGGTVSMPKLEVITGELVDSVLRNSTAMSLLARMQQKDEYIRNHSLESSVWALVFGRHLGLDRDSLNAVGMGALLLDVGKTRIPVKLLNKTGELTDVERDYMRSHVEMGLEILKQTSGMDGRVLEMVATHHERYDGSGYPKGWKGNQIPVFGRIAGIVDSYSAMISDRPYAKAMSSFDAMREFKSLADKHFQAEMVEQFIQAIGIFPVGTLVELNTGEIAVVLKENMDSRLQPTLAIVRDSDKSEVAKIKTLDLSKQKGPRPTVWIERGIEAGTFNIDPRDYFL